MAFKSMIRYEGMLIMKGFKILFKGFIGLAKPNAQRYRFVDMVGINTAGTDIIRGLR